MATIDRAKLRKFFHQFATARVRLPRARGNLYEAYVFLTVVNAAKVGGFRVQFQGILGGTFRFRASPGTIDPRFGFALLTSPRGTPYALRNGIEVVGRSTMYHEADVLLLPARVTSPRPAWTDLLLTLECKNYASVAGLKGEGNRRQSPAGS